MSIEVQTGKVYSFLLITGQEIVAKLVGEDNNVYHVENPLGIGINPQQNSLQFMPCMMSSNEIKEVPLPKNHILLLELTRSDILDAYKQNTTPIKLPKKKKIITG